MTGKRPEQKPRGVPAQEPRQYSEKYEAGSWLTEETALSIEVHGEEPHVQAEPTDAGLPFQLNPRETLPPDARERSRLLRLLGLINYRILTGNKVYIDVGGVVYRTLFGAYWRSVFTGVEHYLLRCQEVSGGVWAEGSDPIDLIDLPVAHTRDGWTAQGHSLTFMLNR